MNKSIYFITGPTAIGKSSFALKLAEQINGEIINADSMQIYKELEVVSARPSTSEKKLIKHHLYGYVDGSERYNVEKWCTDASKIINLLNTKDKTSIFVGGTGLYIDTLINGISNVPKIPESIKKQSSFLFNKVGPPNFYKLVKDIDYESLKNIQPNDSQRLKRVWEVYIHTKRKLSDFKKNSNKKFIDTLDYKIILFLPNRNENYQRVNKRVLLMIDNGAINEIKKLKELNYNTDLPIMRAHGVPEIISYLDKDLSLEDCIKNMQLVTRHYVKRQHTWWNSSKLKIFRKIDQFPSEIDIKSTNLALI